MEMSYDGMPLKISSLLSFISEFNVLKLSGPRCIKSLYVAGNAPTPALPKALWKDVTTLIRWNSETVAKMESGSKIKPVQLFVYLLCD